MGGNGEPFYAVTDMPPPLGIKVRVIWATKRGITAPFECVRWIKNGHTFWTTFVDGKPVNVPPRRAEIPAPFWTNWQHLTGVAPAYWAPPVPAHTWQAPLPAPAYHWIDPNAVPNRTGNVERFEDPEAGDDRLSWQPWRDETKIDWDQTAEDLTLVDCQYRMMRAVALSAAGRIGRRDAGSITSMALARAVEEAAPYVTDDASVPFRGCRHDLGENFIEAMRWFTALGPDNDGWRLRDFSREQKILVWRSLPMPLSYAEIGQLLDGKNRKKEITGERVRQIEKEAIEKAWRVAAGLRDTRAEIMIEQLRERNRRAKRNQRDTAYNGEEFFKAKE